MFVFLFTFHSIYARFIDLMNESTFNSLSLIYGRFSYNFQIQLLFVCLCSSNQKCKFTLREKERESTSWFFQCIRTYKTYRHAKHFVDKTYIKTSVALIEAPLFTYESNDIPKNHKIKWIIHFPVFRIGTFTFTISAVRNPWLRNEEKIGERGRERK